jgi:TRAP-type C4-dicarboxylate transport system permease small subunit
MALEGEYIPRAVPQDFHAAVSHAVREDGALMKHNVALTISSLLMLLLFLFHLTDDTLHAKAGMDARGTVICLLIMLTLLYGTVELAGRRVGYVITLLGGLAALYMPFLHGLGPGSTKWGFFFVWTMLALAVTGAFSAILSAQALFRSLRARRAIQG